MFKVSICGHFGLGKELFDGQTVKTRTVYQALLIYISANTINVIDTYKWKKAPFSLLIKVLKASFNSKNIIILPAHKGIKIFLPLFVFFKRFFGYRLHYIVIGEWLDNLTNNNKWLKFFLKEIDYIYVETEFLKNLLEKNLFLKNVVVMPNFKDLNIISKKDIQLKKLATGNLRFCMFARVMKEKGVEDAINIVHKINNAYGYKKCSLDIYGAIEKNYESNFKNLICKFPQFIRYCGCVEPNKSVEIIKNYDLLLFPTKFYTEGVPGTIIDAYAAGVPVIAAKWQSADEIVKNRITGLLFEFNNILDFEKKVKEYIELNNDLKYKYKINCLNMSYKFLPENIITRLVKRLME